MPIAHLFRLVPHRHDVFTGCYTATYTPWAPLPIMEPVLQTEFGRQKYTTMMICDEPHILENGYNYQRDSMHGIGFGDKNMIIG